MLHLYNSTSGRSLYAPKGAIESDSVVVIDRELESDSSSHTDVDQSPYVSPAFSNFSFAQNEVPDYDDSVPTTYSDSEPLKSNRTQSVPAIPVAFVPLKDGPYRSKRSTSDPEVKSQRSLSRKLPPKLTESLERLSISPPLSGSATSSPSKLSRPLYLLDVDSPEIPAVPVIMSSIAIPARPSKSTRRKASVASTVALAPPVFPKRVTSLPAATSTPSLSASSPYLATPTSSMHHQRGSDESGRSPVSCSSGSASACGTWSVIEDEEFRPKKRESRTEKKERRRAEKAMFDVDTAPTMRALYEASLMDVIAEDGQLVKFGDLVRRGTTIVIFIRHWFCPLCAQYMNSIVSEVSQSALDDADVELVIIGNGSSKMLPAYKNKALKCPFKMYTDPTLSVYRALGLTRQTGNAGPDSEAGDYLIQTPLEATMATLKRATQMPLRNPGHFTQLGGEFVFNGTLNVTYTHRMTTTRSHAPIRDVCAQAGVRLEWLHYDPGPAPPIVHRPSIVLEDSAELDEDAREEIVWQDRRENELERIRTSKEIRRKGLMWGEARKVVHVVGEDEEESPMRNFEVESTEVGMAR